MLYFSIYRNVAPETCRSLPAAVSLQPGRRRDMSVRRSWERRYCGGRSSRDFAGTRERYYYSFSESLLLHYGIMFSYASLEPNLATFCISKYPLYRTTFNPRDARYIRVLPISTNPHWLDMPFVVLFYVMLC